jgi:hypothetical protein
MGITYEQKGWRSGSERPSIGISKTLQCSKAFSVLLRKTLYESVSYMLQYHNDGLFRTDEGR